MLRAKWCCVAVVAVASYSAAQEADNAKHTVLITGGTGLLGKALTRDLLERGHTVRHLTRSPKNRNEEVQEYGWDLAAKTIEDGAFEGVTVVVHLAGKSLASARWNSRTKAEFISSRVDSTNLLREEVHKSGVRLDAFVCANAIGYYGAATDDKIHTEVEEPASDYPGQLCKAWEDAAMKFQEDGIRTCTMRIGVVLAREAGALREMEMPITVGLGAMGSGKQWFPWIHIDDVSRGFVKAIEDTRMRGAYNLVAPDHKTNQEVSAAIANKVAYLPLMIPIPAFAMRIGVGEFASMLLDGCRVSPAKLQQSGFFFKYPGLPNALNNLYRE